MKLEYITMSFLAFMIFMMPLLMIYNLLAYLICKICPKFQVGDVVKLIRDNSRQFHIATVIAANTKDGKNFMKLLFLDGYCEEYPEDQIELLSRQDEVQNR